jgi:hypothetical protein
MRISGYKNICLRNLHLLRNCISIYKTEILSSDSNLRERLNSIFIIALYNRSHNSIMFYLSPYGSMSGTANRKRPATITGRSSGYRRFRKPETRWTVARSGSHFAMRK